MTTRQISYNKTTKAVYVQGVGEDIPEGAVDIGTIELSANEAMFEDIQTLLSQRSMDDPSELATFPNNITDMSQIQIFDETGVVDELTLDELELDDGEEGTEYTFFATFSGGIPPYVFSLDTPPTGVTIDEDTGEVTVADSVDADDYTISVILTDGEETEATMDYELTIAAL